MAKPTRFFLDTEFIEDGNTIDLVSIALVADRDTLRPPRNRHFYAINEDCDYSRADKWVQENVISKLPLRTDARKMWMSRKMIRKSVLDFVRSHPEPYEFWAYFADYDWVVFCQLFGRMIDLPAGFPRYCNDLKQEMHRLGLSRANLPDNSGEHDAFEDAKWACKSWNGVRIYEKTIQEGYSHDVALQCGMLRP